MNKYIELLTQQYNEYLVDYVPEIILIIAVLYVVYIYYNISSKNKKIGKLIFQGTLREMATAIDHLKQGNELWLTLKQKTRASQDTSVYKFSFEPAERNLGILPGRHLMLQAEVDEKPVKHHYTPICILEPGCCELMIKCYKPTEKFPKGGRLTQYIDNMKTGDKIQIVKGNYGKCCYLGRGEIELIFTRKSRGRFKRIGFIAGGTGITPLLAKLIKIYEKFIQAMAKEELDLYVSLLFVNRTQDDILLRDELERLAENGTINKLTFALTRPKLTHSSKWKGYARRPDLRMIKETMPEPADDTIVLHCGSAEFNKCMKEFLLQLGYNEDFVIK